MKTLFFFGALTCATLSAVPSDAFASEVCGLKQISADGRTAWIETDRHDVVVLPRDIPILFEEISDCVCLTGPLRENSRGVWYFASVLGITGSNLCD